MDSGAFLYAGATGVCIGIAAALLFAVNFLFLAFLLTAAILCLCFYGARPDKRIIIAAILCCTVIIGVARTESFLQRQAEEDLTAFDSQRASVVGIVTNDPDRRETSLHVNIFVSSISGAPAHGTVLALLNRDEKISYGDRVEIEGVLSVPQPFETESGHMFDYASYLKVQGISVMMQQAVLVRDEPARFSLQGSLFNLKHAFERSVEKLFPEPDNSLLEGILLGERRGIQPDLMQAFVSSGLVHVVVLSGHNITIVSEGVFRLLAFLPRTAQFGFGSVTMILFALMTGAGATTVRALVMASVALLARYLHRNVIALRALAVAGAGMALWNPNTLLYDPSFILSMLATFGLITLSPFIEHKLSWVPNFKKFDLRSIIASTISVEIFILPALLYFSGILSLISVPANALALPVIPLAMLSGFVAGILGFIHPALAFAPALLCDLLLKWILLVANTAQALPFAALIIPAFSAWIVAALYIPLTLLAIQVSKKYSSVKK